MYFNIFQKNIVIVVQMFYIYLIPCPYRNRVCNKEKVQE